ncbi:surface-anchored fimbrial subunit [Corynebacterium diphtheriae]|nr:cell surface protein [Corynebacterium diphtheriae]OWN50114.1 cell surface protein [Corynebacterium diphtheriae bv. gravis]OFI62531.1 cell surface protein [Corynebacterium diphtheriae]OIR73864.1 cell surface protein [Corynebacterium diphtheriae]OIR73986.1 cell surface protein [Corynebacterium diphtheriae]
MQKPIFPNTCKHPSSRPFLKGRPTMKKSHLFRIPAATTAAVALLLASGPIANADGRTITGATDGLNISDIRCDTGSLTLIKRPPAAFEGVDKADLPAGTIDGATFTLRRIEGIDLTKQAGWDAAKALTIQEARSRLSDEVWKAVSGRDGRAVVTGLPMGVYLVSETPPAKRPAEYRRTLDFLITVPAGMRTADGNVASWSCDVQVFTKDTDDLPPTVPVFPPVESSVTLTPSSPVPGTPKTLGKPDLPEKFRKEVTDRLGNTGANVLGIAALGIALAIAGFLVQRRKKNEENG